MAPAAVARVVIKYRYGMGWLAVDNQLIERVLAGFHTGRSLNGVNTANQIERVDDKQMDSHDVLPDKAVGRVTFKARRGEFCKITLSVGLISEAPYPAYIS
ncbi:hypothetical protein SARI_04691 [Salmonella enterica subsp. arizonae serovar 62:z4,z23:-]|uniref:Uncharacterized protein n=1 Tax=Salmonella arizonae (strain ATCC BAA-731 / CDC346-86 / RSK2980) TaxID=41514 RepID=A9MSB1_SALAR|nr:hypothetical protein SARI_04691 [Salmonella enterica subsp. arizonae serovar 62:z4,z23:-]